MIPYVQQPSVSVGPITIALFGVIVSGAVLAGLEIGRRRVRQLGLDSAVGEGMAWYAVVGGFIGAHLFSVLFYFPRELIANPLLLFKLWQDISSFGGILGGFLAIWVYFRFKAKDIDAAMRRVYIDVAAFTFPMALAIGRIACSIAHDHPGTITNFPLSVSLESSSARQYIAGIYQHAGRAVEMPPDYQLAQFGFHDLGWYEFLYLSIVVVPATLLVARRYGSRRTSGVFLALFILLYMPVRFALDFLRVSDARYVGLTPGQWVALISMLALVVSWLRRRAQLAASSNRGGLTPESTLGEPPRAPLSSSAQALVDGDTHSILPSDEHHK